MPEPGPVNYKKIARQQLAAKQPVPVVEQTLVDAGLDPESATKLVDQLLAESLAISLPLAPPSPRWSLVLVGLVLVAGGFYLWYIVYKAKVMKGEAGPANPLFLPGAGVALAGGRMIQKELMKLLS